MDTTKQLATNQASKEKLNQMEQELSKPTTSDSSKNSENKETCSIDGYETYDVFTLVTIKGETHIMFGGKIVGERPFKTIAEAKKFINQKPWKLLLVTTQVYLEKIKEIENL